MAKVEVIIRGKSVKVQDHLLNDLAKFGVTQNKRQIVPFPKEIIQPKAIVPKLVVPEVKPAVPEIKVEPKAEPVKGNFEKTERKVAKPKVATPKSK